MQLLQWAIMAQHDAQTVAQPRPGGKGSAPLHSMVGRSGIGSRGTKLALQGRNAPAHADAARVSIRDVLHTEPHIRRHHALHLQSGAGCGWLR